MLPEHLTGELARASLSLARRFAGGATMWCCSPAWPHHARHVAVEFVHPVIVGKRALPALAVRSPDPVVELEASVRDGDVVVAVAAADDAAVDAVMRRGPAWGVTTVWVGAGPRPEPVRADHLLWLDDAEPEVAAGDGQLILLYHLLWELTHVCFEHPGVVAPDAAAADHDAGDTAS